jgi:hypothetical protein
VAHTVFWQEVAGLDPQGTAILGPFVLARDEWGDALDVLVDDGQAVDECTEDNGGASLGAWPCGAR